MAESCDIIQSKLETFADLASHTSLAPSEIADLLHFSLSNTYLYVGEEFFQQAHGCAMGKPSSPVVAEQFMTSLEEQILHSCPHKPALYVRYVDDIFIVWTHGKTLLLEFLECFNTGHPAIRFTMELESHNCLPFLDVNVTKICGSNQVWKLATSVYRKPSDVGHFIPFMSYHSMEHKMAAIKCFTHRAFSHCSSVQFRQQELSFIYDLFRKNGFPASIINAAMTSVAKKHLNQGPIAIGEIPDLIRVSVPFLGPISQTLRRLAWKCGVNLVFSNNNTLFKTLCRPKTPLPLDQRSHVVYHIQCSCKKRYIGQTEREYPDRIKEHKMGHQSANPRGAFQHHQDHQPLFDEVTILCSEPSLDLRELKEAFFIQKCGQNAILNINIGMRTALNRNRGRVFDPIWHSIIEKLPALPALINQQE